MDESMTDKPTSISETVESEIDYLKSLIDEKPEVHAGELGATLASAVASLSISKPGSSEQFRGSKLLLGLVDMVDEVSQNNDLAPVFVKAFAVQLKASLSPDE